jgi:hypothetical protein
VKHRCPECGCQLEVETLEQAEPVAGSTRSKWTPLQRIKTTRRARRRTEDHELDDDVRELLGG